MDELQADLNEAEIIESEKRGPGRPKGSGNKSSSKTATRMRVRAFRARQYEQKLAETEDCERSDEIIRRLRQQGFTLFGELEAIGPNGFPVDAQNAEEELMLAKEYAAALGLPDIRPGQTIRNFVTEILRAWCSSGAKMFNRTTHQFSVDEFEGLNPDNYGYPDGVDQTPIQEVTEVTANV